MSSSGNNNRDSEKVFTAKRCSRIFSASSKWKDLKTLAGKEDVTLEKIQSFIKAAEESRDYSGIFFSNKFMVDQPISLTGMGFYGPYDKISAKYNIYIEVADSNSTIATTVQTIEAKKEEIFTVVFPNCFSITPHKYYTIRFRLDGPKTCIGDGENIRTKCSVEGVNFDFDIGSQQMPTLLFKL